MFKKRTLLTLVSLLAILCVTVGGTLAYLVTTSGPITNTFQPTTVTTQVVEKFDGKVKSDVVIKNTGTTDAYIRAAVVATWQDKDGNVYGKAPVPNVDFKYATTLKNGEWQLGSDGFYYYAKPVAPGASTTQLIREAGPDETRTPEGYYLSIEIIGSGIQAKGKDANGKTPVELAWGEAAAKAVGAK